MNKRRLEMRSRLLSELVSPVSELCQKQLGITEPNQILRTLENLWLPLATRLAEERKVLERPLIQGILGGQGTGKTSLTKVVSLILAHLGYNTLGISIDDLYKTFAERQHLKQEDPRLARRGPPGTHDVKLGIELLEQLRQPHQKYPIAIPRFDKSLHNGEGDRIAPQLVEQVDIVLFEGWFVGVRPVPDETVFNHAPYPIVTPEDRQFARDMNQRLKEYLPLWERLDSLIVFYPKDYHWSKQWRWEAEQKMIASGKSGMSQEAIYQFVEYFWKALHPELFITPLTLNPDIALVIEINQDHSVGDVSSRSQPFD
jgi:D-glycerate 3-kinase